MQVNLLNKGVWSNAHRAKDIRRGRGGRLV